MEQLNENREPPVPLKDEINVNDNNVRSMCDVWHKVLLHLRKTACNNEIPTSQEAFGGASIITNVGRWLTLGGSVINRSQQGMSN